MSNSSYRHLSGEFCLVIASSRPAVTRGHRQRMLCSQEPSKAAQLAFLKGAPAPPRRAHCVVQVPLPGAGYVYEADVLLSSSPAQVVGWRKVRPLDGCDLAKHVLRNRLCCCSMV